MKLWSVTFFCLLAHLCYATGTGFPPTPDPRLDNRIIGGVPADIFEAPYQVALLKDNYGAGTFIQSCGGSIITTKVVVTSALCTHRTRGDQWKVRAGSTQHTTGGQVVPVSNFIEHPEFNNRLENDISLVILAKPLILGKDVAIINLPYQDQVVIDDTIALVTGWGYLSEGGVKPTSLYKMDLPIFNHELCVRAYEDYHFSVTEKMICAGMHGIVGPAACQVDSGGPMVVDNTLVGVTSWGEGCAQAYYPGVWTKVAAYIKWINNYS